MLINLSSHLSPINTHWKEEIKKESQRRPWHCTHENKSNENERHNEKYAMWITRFQKLIKKNKTVLKKPFKIFSMKNIGKIDYLTCYNCNKPKHIKMDKTY